MTSSNTIAITFFFAVILVTLAITYWAARKTTTTAQLYAAGGHITAWQNGFAITGDLTSAAVFLGGLGIYFSAGYDAMLYLFPALVGFCILLGFIVGPLRRLGRFTFVDVAAARLSPVPIRILGAISTLAVSMMYLIAQLLGAGGLIEILFDIPYELAVVIVGSLMVIYVAFGGMLATTWVQITKAVLLLVGLLTLSVLTLAEIGFDINELYARAASIHKLGSNVFQPGGLGLSTAQAISLSIALGLGIPGLPHILMRFFTVPNPVVARRSLVLSMVLIAVVHIMVFGILGPAGVAFVTDNPDFVTASGAPRGGTNMVALHLANYLGGGVVFGFIAAVAFATILAVVSGLTVASASALSHDLYANVFFKGRHNERTEKIVFRVACLAIGAVAILLAILFKGQNIIYLTGMLYSIAASACFPILLMSIYWDRLTTAGALAGGYTGLVVSVALILIGPSVWVGVLKHSALITNIDQPAMFSVPAAFVVMVVVSLLTRPAVAPALGTRRAGR